MGERFVVEAAWMFPECMGGTRPWITSAASRRPKKPTHFPAGTAIMSTVMVRCGWPTPWTISLEAAGGQVGS